MAYSERFEEALTFAARTHREQVRKGSGVPYITHLLGVASLVGEAGGSEDQVIAGLLHDSIEDCVGPLPDIRQQIRRRFGETVLRVVEACTDTDEIPKPPWRQRKQVYLAHLRALDPEDPALLVSLADKIHNARCIVRDQRAVGEAVWDRFRGGRDGTRWYYAELVAVFAERMPGPLVDELAAVVSRFTSGG